jgi:hypothetical protein
MGIVSLGVGYQQKLDFFFHCFIVCCGREAEYELVDRSVSVLWIMSGALLLGEVNMFKSVNDCEKGCYALTT